MSDSILNIIINTIKKGGGDKEAITGLKKMSASFKGLTGFSLGSVTAIGAVTGAAKALGNFITSSVNEWVEYGTQVDNYSRLLGISTEETSRLIQATDDLFISESTLTSSLQAATRKGIDVSIDGLKRLSEQYLALEKGGERSKFLMDTFGRSGAEMGKLMEQGAEGIQSAMDAIDDSMIVTEEAMRQMIQYKQSVDNLADSWQGFKYQVGQAVIPALDLLLRQLTKGTDAIEEHLLAIKDLEDQISNWTILAALGSQKAKDKVAELQAEVDRLNEEFYGSADAADQYNDALITLSDEYTNIISLASKLQSGNEKLLEAESDLAEYIKKNPLDTKGIEERTQAVEDLKVEQQKMVDQWMVDIFQKMLMADGELSQAEMDFLLQYQVDTGLISEENAKRAQSYYDQALRIMEANGLITKSINSIPTSHTLTFTTKYVTHGTPTTGGGAIGIGTLDDGENKRGPSGANGKNNQRMEFANGVDFVVPPGYPNDSFGPLWVESGERVQVTPAGQGSGGNTITIQVNGAGDPDLVANKIMQRLKLQGIR